MKRDFFYSTCIVLAALAFQHSQPLIPTLQWDAEWFMKMAQSNAPTPTPYCYRLGLPFLASLFSDAGFGFVALNVGFSIAAILLLPQLIKAWGFSFNNAYLCTLVYAFSYWSPLRQSFLQITVDAPATFFIFLGLLSYEKGWTWAWLASIFLGTFIREDAFITALPGLFDRRFAGLVAHALAIPLVRLAAQVLPTEDPGTLKLAAINLWQALRNPLALGAALWLSWGPLGWAWLRARPQGRQRLWVAATLGLFILTGLGRERFLQRLPYLLPLGMAVLEKANRRQAAWALLGLALTLRFLDVPADWDDVMRHCATGILWPEKARYTAYGAGWLLVFMLLASREKTKQ